MISKIFQMIYMTASSTKLDHSTLHFHSFSTFSLSFSALSNNKWMGSRLGRAHTYWWTLCRQIFDKRAVRRQDDHLIHLLPAGRIQMHIYPSASLIWDTSAAVLWAESLRAVYSTRPTNTHIFTQPASWITVAHFVHLFMEFRLVHWMWVRCFWKVSGTSWSTRKVYLTTPICWRICSSDVCCVTQVSWAG